MPAGTTAKDTATASKTPVFALQTGAPPTPQSTLHPSRTAVRPDCVTTRVIRGAHLVHRGREARNVAPEIAPASSPLVARRTHATLQAERKRGHNRRTLAVLRETKGPTKGSASTSTVEGSETTLSQPSPSKETETLYVYASAKRSLKEGTSATSHLKSPRNRPTTGSSESQHHRIRHRKGRRQRTAHTQRVKRQRLSADRRIAHN